MSGVITHTNMDYEVVVVGAGPAGCLAAKYAAKNGAKTLIIEEHASIGSPVQCAGLLSVNAVRECEITPDSRFHPITGAFVYAPDGRRIRIAGDEIRAYVVDRRIFDRTLAQDAVCAGAEILMRTRAVGMDIRDHGNRGDRMNHRNHRKVLHVLTEGDPDSIEADVVIGADGIQNHVARWAGLDMPETILSGAQLSTIYDFDDTNFVEIFLGSCAPGFFAWAVPYHNSARIGLAVRSGSDRGSESGSGAGAGSAWDHLQRLVSEHRIVSEKCRSGISEIVLGGIPIGVPQRAAADGVLIAGDAAGQVKPTSGGGVYPGAICAKIAGKVAADAVREGDTSLRRLALYDRLWRARIGRELAIGKRINEWMANLGDSRINRLIEVLDDDELLDMITRYGDMDHPSVVVRKLLMSRKSVGVFAKLIRMI
uniref:Digeranylgeranylglycerophospholipid reductase n=1 Tax=uncultured Methanosarcinales archaeon TaxID=183757 RepID=A0A7H1KNQ9_9EURY|nr:digeranylgeranylglycerophospholipid reductase [uncultured Methanosarcinales archaeon]